MKRRALIVTIVLSMLMVLVVPAVSAAGHETIVDVAVSDDRFETLVAAVVAADLADELSSGEWTVFAPTDAAFAKLGLNANNIADTFSKAELTDILLYHALPAAVNSATAKNLVGDITMANGEQAGLKVFAGDLYINDDAKVIIPDIATANGIIHVVDNVILGPWPRGEETPGVGGESAAVSSGNTIVDIAAGDDRFETLVAAVVAADLADTLSGTSDYTVFAPTDAAFAKLGLNADNIASSFSKAELTDILLYHVIPGEITSDKALASLGDVTMANGEQAGLKFFAGDLYVNDDAKVIIPDINASNGVIHVVDTVILGPWPK